VKRPTLFLTLLWVVIVLMAVPADAVPVTYVFTVSATGGPLNGVTESGMFTFDEIVIPAGGGYVSGDNLLTNLSFTWHGIAYDETTANTGFFGFDAAANLSVVAFGNNHQAGSVTVQSGQEQWSFVESFTDTDPFFSHFAYSVPAAETYWFGTVSSQRVPSVPEPSAMLLLGSGLIGLVVIRREFIHFETLLNRVRNAEVASSSLAPSTNLRA
jgi:hypothetical protein